MPVVAGSCPSLRALALLPSSPPPAVSAGVTGAAPAGAATRYPVGTAASGDAKWVATPDANPAGVNTGCQPSAAHPRPVVLLEGTTSRLVASFDRLGPQLANAGYCVYG